jgi:hypothetical protein
MASVNKSDLAASNQLNISIKVITNAQGWKNQIRGVYTFLYPHMIKDFTHLDDWKQWRQAYDKHLHGNGNNGSPTTAPTVPIIWTEQKAKANVTSNDAVGNVRKGFNQVDETTKIIKK